MPSGYTSAIYDGKDVTLRDFILTCARGMGALITMRDEPFDKPIPDEFPPCTSYHDEAIAKARERLARITKGDRMELLREKQDEYNERLQQWWEAKRESDALKKRYEDMMEKVLAWEPPTPDHEGLKKLMIDQLSQSLEHDCHYSKFDTPKDDPYRGMYGPEEKSLDQWIEDERAAAIKEIEYHIEQRNNEIERARSRTEWVQQLKAALPEGIHA